MVYSPVAVLVFCRAKTSVEQEQLFQSLKSAKSKLSEGIREGREI